MKLEMEGENENLPASLRSAFLAIVLGSALWGSGMIGIYAHINGTTDSNNPSRSTELAFKR